MFASQNIVPRIVGMVLVAFCWLFAGVRAKVFLFQASLKHAGSTCNQSSVFIFELTFSLIEVVQK